MTESPLKNKAKFPGVRHALKKWWAFSGLAPSFRLDILNRMLEFGQWVADNQIDPIFETRRDLYQYLNNQVIGSAPVDYLEFGVYQGGSISAWMELNQHPKSTFAGFDTFEGLPEDWRDFIKVLPRGTFNTGGKMPESGDPRVRFFKGLFQATLPGFLDEFTPHNRLVVNCDADLYTSTLYVLANLDHLIAPGSIVIFDELSSMHEFRAFRDYTQSFMRRYRVLAAAGPFYLRVALEFI